MTLKTKLFTLCILLHGFLLTAAWQYMEEPDWMFIGVEGVLLLSMVMFLLMIRKTLEPIEQLALFKDILNEQDFTARFPATQNNELDQLAQLFNQMLTQLYQERLKLGDRKGMLQQLMDALPTAILVFDYEQRLSQLNPGAEKLLGVENNTVKGAKLASLSHPIAGRLEGVPLGEPSLLTDAMGKRYRVQRNVFRDRGFDRQFIIIEELTQALQSSEKKTYEKLIRLMSHEVNNTMAATGSLLKSCLYYADQIDVHDRQDYKDAMELVIERTDNLSHFMQDFANMVRLPQPAKELCNLHHMLMATKKLFEVKLNQRNITFSIPDAQQSQPMVNIDRNQMEQVLINIVKNAMEAIDADGQIEAMLVQSQDCWQLSIKDSGPGLSDSSQQDLFTPFFTTKAQGQGLGLMLVREILDAHGCEFALYNADQQGACFDIRFS